MKHAVQAIVTTTYVAGARVAGRLRGLRASEIASDGRQRVVVVAPHPDDEVAGCGATIAMHRQAGDRVAVVALTDGRLSRALGLAPEAMAAARRGEAEKAARRLGADLVWIGLPEGAWPVDQASNGLRTVLDEHRPTVIYAPSCLDFHPEHRRVAHALGRALGAAPTTSRAEAIVRVYAVQVPLSADMIDRILPADEFVEPLRHALDAYRSQRGTLEPCLRLRRYTAALFATGRLAEGFWEMPPSVYRRLHAPAGEEADGRSSDLRGMRYAALSDPLAFFAGRRARRELLRRAATPDDDQAAP